MIAELEHFTCALDPFAAEEFLRSLLQFRFEETQKTVPAHSGFFRQQIVAVNTIEMMVHPCKCAFDPRIIFRRKTQNFFRQTHQSR